MSDVQVEQDTRFVLSETINEGRVGRENRREGMRKFLFALVLVLFAHGLFAQTPHGVYVTFSEAQPMRDDGYLIDAGIILYFNIYRCPGIYASNNPPACPMVVVGTTPNAVVPGPQGSVEPSSLTYVDPSTGLATNTTYSYMVTAVDILGNETPPSSVVSITTPSKFLVNENPPTGLKVTVQ